MMNLANLLLHDRFRRWCSYPYRLYQSVWVILLHLYARKKSPKPWPDGTWIELRNRILGYLKSPNYNSTESGSVFWRDTTRASLVDLNITSIAFSGHQMRTKNLTFLVSNMCFPHWTHCLFCTSSSLLSSMGFSHDTYKSKKAKVRMQVPNLHLWCFWVIKKNQLNHAALANSTQTSILWWP